MGNDEKVTLINILRGMEEVAYKAVDSNRFLLKISSRGACRIDLAYFAKVDSMNMVVKGIAQKLWETNLAMMSPSLILDVEAAASLYDNKNPDYVTGP